jgi:hypothetical protein
MSAIGATYLSCYRFMLRMLTWDRIMPLGESRELSVRKGRESNVESRHLQGGSPRLCRLRTNELALTSKYWMYQSCAGDVGPLNWYSLLRTDAWLFSTTSMVVIGGKLGMDPQIGQPLCYGLGWEPFFSGVVDPFNPVDDFTKGYHVRGLSVGSICVAYMDWRGKRTCHVY